MFSHYGVLTPAGFSRYNLGLRYTGGARMLLTVPIQSGPVKVEMPVSEQSSLVFRTGVSAGTLKHMATIKRGKRPLRVVQDPTNEIQKLNQRLSSILNIRLPSDHTSF